MAKAARAAAAPAAAPAEPAPPPALSVPAPVTPPASADPVQPDLFDLAFAEAAAAEAAAEPSATVAPAKKPPEPKLPPEPLAAELEAGLEPSAPAPAPAQPEPQPQPPAAQPAPVQPQPPVYQPQPQPPAAQPAQPYQEPPVFNTGELEQLQTFYTEWPDVARATEVMIRGLVSQTVRRMYADMASSLAPYLQTIDTLADRSQLSELQTQVSDYDTVANQLTTWAANQPAYLRSAYERVIKSGTAAEVVDMINRYKQDMQSTTPAHASQPAPAAPAAATPAPVPVNPALAAAAARLAPVATKRTNVVAPPTDFDSAFAEYAKAS